MSDFDLIDAMQSEVSVPTDDQLVKVGELARHQRMIEEEIETLDAAMEDAKKRLTSVRTKALPEAMLALGLTEFSLTDGTQVKVKDAVAAHLTKNNKEAALEWLRSVGQDGIVKSAVVVTFSKGQDEEARRAVKILSEAGFDPIQTRDIHPQTLLAFVKEQLSRENALGEGTIPSEKRLPKSVFGVHEFTISQVVSGKKKRNKEL